MSNASTPQYLRSTIYQGNQIGDNARAHFGDQNNDNHGVIIHAGNVNIDDRILQRLAQLSFPSTRKTFGSCLAQTPQIEQDAFVGRTAELRQLQEWFSQDTKAQRVVSIVGMGGLGKTQLSLAYARQCNDRYTSVFWVNAKDETSLRQSLSAVANTILADSAPRATNTSKEQEQVEVVRRWLSEEWNNQWLLLVDNYDDPSLPNIHSSTGFDIRSYFPYREQGHILVTTRSPKLTFSKRLMLQKLDNIDLSLAILTQRAGRDLTTDKDARKLANRLDGLPLALATAGVYLGQTNASCTEYLQAYESTWTELYGCDSEELLEYEGRTMSSTWVVSFDYVCRLDADAAELFKFWAYLDSKDIWYELIRTGADSGPAWMDRVTVNKIKFDRTMAKLQDYSLVHIVAGSYSIHPCIHDWISEHFNVDRTAFLAALDCVAEIVPPESQVQYWRITQRLLSHVNRLNEERFRMFWDTSDQKILYNTYIIGALLFHWGQLEPAEAMLLRSMTGYEETLGLDDLSTLCTVSCLGVLYYRQGKLDEAEKMLLRALAGREKALGQDHDSTSTTLDNLGDLYLSQGKLDQAEKMYLRALTGKMKALGQEHPSTMSTIHNLRRLYIGQGKLHEAEMTLLRALVGKEKALEGVHTLSVSSDLGLLPNTQGKRPEAEEKPYQVLASYKDHDTQRRRQGIVNHLAMIVSKSVRVWVDSDDIQAAKHQLARLVRYIESWGRENPGAVNRLVKALISIKDDENAQIALLQAMKLRDATTIDFGGFRCDGCENEIALISGRHICRVCDDVDLCNECMSKYVRKTTNVPTCEGHEYFDAASAVSSILNSPEMLNQIDMDAWIERLKETYPVEAGTEV